MYANAKQKSHTLATVFNLCSEITKLFILSFVFYYETFLLFVLFCAICLCAWVGHISGALSCLGTTCHSTSN